ncbi:UNVERIFIED_CONTAM: hypothetical protein BEN50_02310 [Euhalothece sp. KZN 001]
MPIKTIEQNLSPRFPLLGKICKGAKKSSNRPGKDLDYFRLDTKDPSVKSKFSELYGEAPKKIGIYSLGQTRNDTFSCYYEQWTKSKIHRRCDGEIQEKKLSDDGESYLTGVACESQQCQCKPIGRFKCIIAGIGRLGFFELVTTSIYDIKHLNDELYALEQWIGTLEGVPLILYRIPEEVSGTINGQKRKVKVNLLHVELHPRFVEQVSNQKRNFALSGNIANNYLLESSEQTEEYVPEVEVLEEIEEESNGIINE